MSLSLVYSLGYPLGAMAVEQPFGTQKLLFLMGSETALNRARQVVDGFSAANQALPVANDFVVIQTDISLESDSAELKGLQRQVDAISGLDFIVVSWLSELEFATRYTSDIPIINLSPVLSDSPRVITLTDDLDERIFRTAQLSLTLPRRSKVATVVLADFAENQMVRERVRLHLELAGYESVVLIEDRNLEQISASLDALSAADTVFYFPFTEDEAGIQHLPKDVVAQLAQQTDAPIFSMWTNFIGQGAVGGYAFNPQLAGEAIARLVDDSVSGRGVTEYSVSGLVIDQTRFEKFGGELDRVFGRFSLVNEASTGLTTQLAIIIALFAALGSLGWVLHFYGRRSLQRSERLNQYLKNYQMTLMNMERVAKIGSWELDLKTQKITWSQKTRLIHEVEEEFVPTLETGIQFYEEGESREAIKAAVQDALQTGKPWDLELAIITRKNNRVWVRAQGQVEFNSSGEAVRLFGVFQDINDRYHHEQELLAANQRAEQSSRMKSEFLANMSHEIRTPMNAVLGLAQVLTRRSMYPETVVLQASKIVRAGESLQHLLNDILDFSKIESGKLTLNPMPTRIAEVEDNLALMMTSTARDRQLELIIHPCKFANLVVIGDQLRIEQVLINLLSNAIKFTEQGSVVLEIDSAGVTENGEISIRFLISDSGIGMQADEVLNVLEPFSQADGSITRRFGGSGLGLTISQRLLALMGSELKIESTPNQGTDVSFTLTLPVAESTNEASDLDESSSQQAPEVLIVDDHEVAREALQLSTATLGWHSQLAEGGREAIALYQQQIEHNSAPDLVLMDWKMPGVDGITAANEIKKAALASGLPNPPIIIMVTAYDQSRIDEMPHSDAIDLVLNKPVTPQSLRRVFSTLAQSATRAASEGRSSVPGGRLAGAHLLVVDDNMFNRDVAKTIFEADGAQVSLANDGQEALDWLRAPDNKADVVLMDVQMPTLDGLTATRQLRQLPEFSDLPIIGMSAGAYQTDIDDAMAAGMDDYIVKPFDVQALIESVMRQMQPDSNAPPVSTGAGEEANRPIFDESTALSVWRSAARLADYLQRFVDEYSGAISSATQDQSTVDAQQLHKIKGAAGTLFLLRLSQSLQSVEDQVRQNRLSQEDLQQLARVWEETVKTIKVFLSEHC